MRKLVGIILLAALILVLVACTNGALQAEYEAYIERDEITADYDNGFDDSLIDDDLPLPEPQEKPAIKTDAFAELASGERGGEITHIVLHFISNVIANPMNPYIMEDIEAIFQTYGVSAHYIIDRDGTIHLAVPENRVAFHAGAGALADFPEYENNLNQYSIGIELLGIGTQEEMSQFLSAAEYNALDPSLIGFTDAQYMSLNWLLNDILARHPTIQPNRTHIIGHSEYAPDNPDPGALFEWERLDFMNTP